MIVHEDINIFDTNPFTTAIVHQCNCCGVMGAGLAKEVKARYPLAFMSDIKAHSSELYGRPDRSKMGSISSALCPDGRLVINLYGQFLYGRVGVYTDSVAVLLALTTIKREWPNLRKDHTQLAIPYLMGCGLGGGDWEEIYKHVLDVFSDSDVDVLICHN